MEISTISSDGQALIPKSIRDYLQLRLGHRITFAIEPNGQVTLRPVIRDISELEGFLKPPSVPLTLEEMNAVIRGRGYGADNRQCRENKYEHGNEFENGCRTIYC
jgi:bifunctional DNA-binding transcriptional regulator/antitoxin component of YhaV-PrlF toxin-antitoxin module